MRLTVPAKKSKIPEEFSVIIPASGFGRRMKSYGSKSLIDLPNDTNVLGRQLSLLKEVFPKSEIILTTGFQSDKVLKFADKFNIKSVENHFYEETSVLYSLGLALRVVSYSDIFIIYGDLVFERSVIENLIFDRSFIVTGPMQADCIGTNIDEKNEICHFGYGLPNKWCQIAFIESKSLPMFKTAATKKDNAKLYPFEIFNKMLDQGYKFRNSPVNGKLVEIESAEDVEEARKIV